MRRNRAELTSTPDSNNSSRPPRREKDKKEDGKPSIPVSVGSIFMAICVSALSSGLRTAKDLTPKSETTNDQKGQTDESKTIIDPKKGQANNSGAEKNPNAPITPSAIPPAPTTTPPAPAPTNLIQKIFALWASPTPTKEDNTKTTAQTADASPKSVSFEDTPKNGKRDTEQSVNPEKTTKPAPPTSILKQTNPSVNEPETVSMLTTATNWLSSFYSVKPTKVVEPDTHTAPVAEMVEPADVAGKRKAPEPPSDGNPNNAKRAKTEMSTEEDKAMQSLINKEVMKRMSQQDNPDNSILVLENQNRVKKNEVTLDFKNKFQNGDPDFMKRLEQEIKALASLEERTSKALSFPRDEGLVKNEPGAKRAKTEKSPEEEAMKNLINEEVATRMTGIKIRDRTNRATELGEKTIKEVTAEFMQKSKNDPLFKELLEKQIKLSAVQEAQSINGGVKKEVKPTSVARKALKITDPESPMSYGEAKQMRLSKLNLGQIDPKQARIDAWEDRREDQAGKRAKNDKAIAEDLGLHIARHNARVATTNLEVRKETDKALSSAEALLNERGQASSLHKSAPSSGLETSERLYRTQNGPLRDILNSRRDEDTKSKVKKGDIVVDASGHGHRDSLLNRVLTNPKSQERTH